MNCKVGDSKTIKYLATNGYLAQINRVEVERETVFCVWINGRRKEKIAMYESIHDTFEAAQKYIASKAQKDCENARSMADRCNYILTRIMDLKEGK